MTQKTSWKGKLGNGYQDRFSQSPPAAQYGRVRFNDLFPTQAAFFIRPEEIFL